MLNIRNFLVRNNFRHFHVNAKNHDNFVGKELSCFLNDLHNKHD